MTTARVGVGVTVRLYFAVKIAQFYAFLIAQIQNGNGVRIRVRVKARISVAISLKQFCVIVLFYRSIALFRFR